MHSPCARLTNTAIVLAAVLAGPLAHGQHPEVESLRLAVDDLGRRFGARYPGAADRLGRLDALAARADRGSAEWLAELGELRREALLAHPLLACDGLLAVRRAVPGGGDGAGGPALGLPQNWQGNCALPAFSYQNEIVLWPGAVGAGAGAQAVYQPPGGAFVGDLDLAAGGDRLLFSMPKRGPQGGAWHVWELALGGGGPRQLTPELADVDQYDGCYLPDGRIVFCSTAGFQGVPCVGGGDNVANLYQLDPASGVVRELCHDQDHNWNPVVMNDGRVMYVRWEYSDTPHYFSRLLFAMNPDGTGQMALYGSNSFWPNSIFGPRPIPGEPSRVVAVVSGHHGVARMGELVLFDLAMGRHEAGGVVQRIPGRGRAVEPVVADQLVQASWPRFLHPHPVDGNNFLVSCQPAPGAPWGIWLVDVFDNMVPVRVEDGYALLEPLLVRRMEAPPRLPDRVDTGRREAEVFVADVHAGTAMAGVPRGTVKRLRVYEFHYAYRRMGGHIEVGIDGPWDVRRILGTVPVCDDGSAFFTVPSNVPVAVQPLDADGRAVQVMRSWFTGQPGERVACAGCHEEAGQAAAVRPTLAGAKPPVAIEPWRGPARGFAFGREVQPVLDRHCVGCHGGGAGGAQPELTGPGGSEAGGGGKPAGGFPASYVALHPYIHRPGPESNIHVANAGEYLAEASELVQMLRKGHHGVVLDAESWDRLATWIDLNVPAHGTWGEQRGIPGDYHRKRMEMRARHANRPEDPEAIPAAATIAAPARRLEDDARPAATCPDGWPLEPAAAARLAGAPVQVELAPGIALELLPVPPGRYLMGTPDGPPDERQRVVEVTSGFHIGRCEVSNRQFACFAPGHDSGFLSYFNKDVSDRGVPLNGPDQPVVRVSWEQADGFCRWLTAKTGRRFRLPTEEEWEWACRAGTGTPLSFGAPGGDFARHANLADRRLADLCRRDSPRWLPRHDAVDDGATGTAAVGGRQPNAWGLCDMHGNAAEWTASVYQPGPFLPHAGGGAAWRVVRGGSFRDRPQRATSGFRYGYVPWLRLRDLGFRVVMEEP